jgi:hypothetical protein
MEQRRHSWEANRSSASKYNVVQIWPGLIVCKQVTVCPGHIFEPPCTFPAIHGTQKFITAFTTNRHLSLSSARSIQSIPPHCTYRRSILILSYHLHLGLPIGLLPSDIPTKSLYAPTLCLMNATCPAHFSLLTGYRIQDTGYLRSQLKKNRISTFLVDCMIWGQFSNIDYFISSNMW